MAEELSGAMALAELFTKPGKDKDRGSWTGPLTVGALVIGFAAGISPRFRRFILGKDE